MGIDYLKEDEAAPAVAIEVNQVTKEGLREALEALKTR